MRSVTTTTNISVAIVIVICRSELSSTLRGERIVTIHSNELQRQVARVVKHTLCQNHVYRGSWPSVLRREAGSSSCVGGFLSSSLQRAAGLRPTRCVLMFGTRRNDSRIQWHDSHLTYSSSAFDPLSSQPAGLRQSERQKVPRLAVPVDVITPLTGYHEPDYCLIQHIYGQLLSSISFLRCDAFYI